MRAIFGAMNTSYSKKKKNEKKGRHFVLDLWGRWRLRIASDKKSLSSRLVHSICVRVNPAFDSSDQEAESYNELS